MNTKPAGKYKSRNRVEWSPLLGKGGPHGQSLKAKRRDDKQRLKRDLRDMPREA